MRENAAPVRPDRSFVLYWMTAQRRLEHNFALDRAIERARALKKPLLVLEALRLDYPWASRRLHRFVVEGMSVQAEHAAPTALSYYPYVERERGEAKGLLRALSANAAAIVTDESPIDFIRRMVEAAAAQLDVQLESVDSNGLLPLGATDRAYPTAHAFRRQLQKTLREHLLAAPTPRPLLRLSLPRLDFDLEAIETRWPRAPLDRTHKWLDELEFERDVSPASLEGGAKQARLRLRRFTEHGLDEYAKKRNQPSDSSTSELSAYLHFGHISAHAILKRVLEREAWDPTRLSAQRNGSREGWWGISAAAEAFLDQLVTWRELGFNFSAHRPNDTDYESLPDWALRTLERHASDARPHLYELSALDSSLTHDPIWNAAQRQLREQGRIPNYLRMLWGKRILEWSHHPRIALSSMIELNNKYALDGRDPNSYSGIFWVLGRYDRAWGPERPIFGTVRYMSSENTRRKLDLRAYLRRWGSEHIEGQVSAGNREKRLRR